MPINNSKNVKYGILILCEFVGTEIVREKIQYSDPFLEASVLTIQNLWFYRIHIDMK